MKVNITEQILSQMYLEGKSGDEMCLAVYNVLVDRFPHSFGFPFEVSKAKEAAYRYYLQIPGDHQILQRAYILGISSAITIAGGPLVEVVFPHIEMLRKG